MLLRAYLPKLLTALFASFFIAAGILTFGNAEIFDRLFIGVLVFTGIICRKNINVVGVVAIIAIQRTVEEIGWFLVSTDYINTVKILFYGFAIWACYFCWYDKVSRILLVCLIITFAAETYWLVTDAKPTSLRWMIFIITIDLLTRDLIFSRVTYTEDLFSRKAKSINLDWHIYQIHLAGILVYAALLVESVLWSIFNLKAADLMYNATPYLMHAVATYIIWVIFQESYKLVLPRLLKA